MTYLLIFLGKQVNHLEIVNLIPMSQPGIIQRINSIESTGTGQ